MDTMEEMVNHRAKIIREIAKQDMIRCELEYEIIREIIDSGKAHLLKVDWDKVNRSCSIPPDRIIKRVALEKEDKNK